MTSTKELARKLGLVRKRGTCHSNLKRVKSLVSQVYDYLIVLDFEATCWKDKQKKSQEIIEFPAVLLNTANGAIEAEFHHYVQPKENPTLSDFCRELTGITQNQVDGGIPLSVCVMLFGKWMKELSQKMGISTGPDGSGQTTVMLVTWSDWDLGVCLHYECRRKQIRKPCIVDSWIDIRATYRNFYHRKPEGLRGALDELGIGFIGREHSGIDDARNTARLCWRMMEGGCCLQATRMMQTKPCVLVGPCSHPSDQPGLTTPITPVASNTNQTPLKCSTRSPSVCAGHTPQQFNSSGGGALFQGKITPPLCGCGRRSIRREVAADGPNHGRAFYSC